MKLLFRCLFFIVCQAKKREFCFYKKQTNWCDRKVS